MEARVGIDHTSVLITKVLIENTGLSTDMKDTKSSVVKEPTQTT